jgi:hypothetical protein
MQGAGSEFLRQAETMREAMVLVERMPDEAKRAMVKALQTKALSVSTVLMLVHISLGDLQWFASRVVDLVDENEILRLHNWAMIFTLEHKEKYQFERWAKVVNGLQYPIFPFDWTEQEIVQYNQALILWATAEAGRPEGAGPTQPPCLLFRDENDKKKKVSGGAPYLDLVQDETGATRVEGGPLKITLDGIFVEINKLREENAALRAMIGKAAPASSGYGGRRATAPRTQDRTQVRCYGCQELGHMKSACPKKPQQQSF